MPLGRYVNVKIFVLSQVDGRRLSNVVTPNQNSFTIHMNVNMQENSLQCFLTFLFIFSILG